MKRASLLLAALLALALGGCDREAREPWRGVPETAHPGAYPEPLKVDLHGGDALSPGCSAFVVGAFVDLPFGVMTFVALALALLHRRRARAERGFDPAAPLRDGSFVIAGVVEAAGTEPPVVVRIVQLGTEATTKHGTSQTWKERSREVAALPFLVRRDDGTRVRVEPDDRVVLHASLTRTERHDLTHRTRVATVAAGDRVHVHGELVGASRAPGGGAYRGAAAMPVLRASRLGRLLVSSEPPGDTEAKLTRFHAWAAALLAGTFLSLSLIVAPAFQVLSLDGQVLAARPLETRAWQVWVKPKNSAGYWVWKYALRAEARAPSGEVIALEDRCGQEVHDCTSRGGCRAVPFLVSRLAPSFHQIGTEPKLDGARPWILVLFGLVLGLMYPFATAEKRPWYARRGLVEMGNGSLQSTMGGDG